MGRSFGTRGARTTAALALIAAVLPAVGVAQTTSQPQLDWSTYFGGATPAPTRVSLPQRVVVPQDTARDVAVDSQGFVYVVGGTATVDFPHTIGPAHAGDMDAFVAKFAPDGTLVWSRFVGGPNYDRAYGVEVRPNGGEIVICGRAGPNMPTQACPTCAGQVISANFNGDILAGAEYGQQDGWVGKLDTNGNLLWLSYFGDDASDLVRDCDIDAQGYVYIGHNGRAGASPSLGTPGAFRPTSYGGSGTDDVIAKLHPEGRSVIWATYIGGTATDDAPSVRVHSDGTVYVASDTASTDFPLVNPVQNTLRGSRDYTLTRIAADGSALLFSTYLGGSGSTEFVGTHNLGIDSAGNAYLCAETDSTDFPGTAGFFQPNNAGGTDHIFAKVKVTAPTAVLAATYVGGPGRDGELSGCSVDAAGNVLAASTSFNSGSNYPVTAGAWQRSNEGDNDAVIVQLAADFKSLQYASYLGGGGDDQGRAAFASGARLVIVGMTKSADFDVRNAIQAAHAENPIQDYDAFVALFSQPSTPTPTRTAPATLTATATPTRTATMTPTGTSTQAFTSTNTPLVSPTRTPTTVPTSTQTATATPSAAASFTSTAPATATAAAPASPTTTVTPLPSATVSATASPTTTVTATPSTTASATASPTTTGTATPSTTASATPTTTVTAPPRTTASVTASPVTPAAATPSAAASLTATPVATATQSATPDATNTTVPPMPTATPTPPPPLTATPMAAVPGDLTGDGIVSSADVLALLDELFESAPSSAADVNHDGAVNDADVVALVQLL